ncbi:MAG: chemotaxis protein CheX [Gammaproteobacteria bacterium]
MIELIATKTGAGSDSDPHDTASPLAVPALRGLRDSVINVLATMAGMDAVHSRTGSVNGLIVAGPVSALIELGGTHRGLVAVTMSESLIRRILARLTGADPQDISRHELGDGIGELANMIAGGMKTRLDREGMTLCMPLSIFGSDFKAYWNAEYATSVLDFEVEGDPMSVHCCLP